LFALVLIPNSFLFPFFQFIADSPEFTCSAAPLLFLAVGTANGYNIQIPTLSAKSGGLYARRDRNSKQIINDYSNVSNMKILICSDLIIISFALFSDYYIF
jgi:hypothetical protein